MISLFGRDKAISKSQIKKYTSLFGSLFTDMFIIRQSGELQEYVQVPIKYGPGQIRNKADNTLDKVRTGMVLPAMAFEFTSATPSPERLTNQYKTIRKGNANPGSTVSEKYVFSPIPHDIKYTLKIRSNNTQDNLLILEQIITAFNPQVSINILDNEDIAYFRDITIKLEPDYQIDDNYEMSQKENRLIETTMEFTVKGYLNKPVSIAPIVLEFSLKDDAGQYEFFTSATDPDLSYYTQTSTADNIGNVLADITKD